MRALQGIDPARYAARVRRTNRSALGQRPLEAQPERGLMASEPQMRPPRDRSVVCAFSGRLGQIVGRQGSGAASARATARR